MHTYSVGSAVEVFSFGRWYAGEVVKLGTTRVVVRYTTGSGATRDKAFPLAKVRATATTGSASLRTTVPFPAELVAKVGAELGLKAKHTTREAWLNAAASGMAGMFKRLGHPLPEKLRVTMSLTKNKKHIGVCYDPSCSADGATEILVRLDRFDPMDVAAILAHELVHAAIGCKEGHGPVFRKVATALGLEGKMTATTAGEKFKADIAPVLAGLGPFPHAALNFAGSRSGPKKQGTRMIKCVCEECGFLVRTTAKWITEVGAPHCPAHGEMAVDGDD